MKALRLHSLHLDDAVLHERTMIHDIFLIVALNFLSVAKCKSLPHQDIYSLDLGSSSISMTSFPN